MSTKRAAAESSNDEQTTEDSDPGSKQQDDAKRAKLVLLSDTTLEDLPIELLECILGKVVAMEVKDMQFAKSVWKEKSELVINRLRTVCSQWSNICVTSYFRNEVNRALVNIAQDKIRFEMLHQYLIQFAVYDMTSVKDEVFILCRPNGQDYFIKVVNSNNIAEVKDVIPLPGISSRCMVGCNVSNCVYVLNSECLETDAESVWRITKAGEHQFTLSPWIATDQKLSLLSVSANGNLITISKHLTPSPDVVTIYAANGFLQRKIVLYPNICGRSTIENVIQKSNGNLVLFSEGHPNKAQLREIDTSGSVVRLYQSPLESECSVNFADNYGRILVANWERKFELLDSEFNLLDVAAVQPDEARVFLPRRLHFNSERNEIMSYHHYANPTTCVVSVFRFI